MKERAPGEHPALLPETQELLTEIQALTGLPVEIRPDPSIRGSARSVYLMAPPDAERHEVLYDPAYEPLLDHLIAHECGHIVRFAALGRHERMVATSSAAQRYDAAVQLLPQLEVMFDLNILNEPLLDELLPLWLSGTVSQLYNTPGDIRIERWLHREFPSLRTVQESSLESQAHEAHDVLSPMIALHTPPLIWEASTAMNYAFTRSSAELFERHDLLEPFERTRAETIGTPLWEMIEATPDTGAFSDQDLTDRWAEHLGLKGWMSWRRLDELPAAYWRAKQERHDQSAMSSDEHFRSQP